MAEPGGYADMEIVGEDVYYITEELAEKLERGYTAGKPEWGYTDERVRRITDWGLAEYWKLREERDYEESENARWN